MAKSLTINDAARCLEKLGHPTRLEIVRLLVRAGPDGLAVGEIQNRLSIPGSTLSHHIAHLVAGGLISQRRIGRRLVCGVEYERIDALVTLLREDCCAGVSNSGAEALETVV